MSQRQSGTESETYFTNPSTSSIKTSSSPSGISTKRVPSISTMLMMASVMPMTALAAESNANNASTPYSVDNSTKEPESTFETINIESDKQTSYKYDQLANAKYTQEVVDVPQTITVITEELIEEQKAFSLVDALRNTPGITMQLGENGRSSEGDAISLRGFSGDNLFQVDGIRNIAPISRDTFNVESVEVTKGGAGPELGRAATGGAINLITKKPLPFEQRSASISVDSVAKTRVSADINHPFSDTLSGRINLMYENGDAVGRDVVKNESIGIAPSITWGLGTPTRITASAEVLMQNNTPDGGIYTVGMDGYFKGRTDYTVAELDFSELDYTKVAANTPAEAVAEYNTSNQLLNEAPKIDTKNYYGDDKDFEDVDSKVFSLFIEHDINDKTLLTNTTRYSKTLMEREVSAPYKAYNSPLEIGRRSNKLKVNDSLANLGVDVNDPATWRIRAIRQGVDRENTTLGNFTNINILDVKTGGISHDFSTGVEFISEKQEKQGLSRPDDNDYPKLYNPDPSISQGDMIDNGSNSEGKTNTLAGYIFDTVTLNDQLQVLGGVRIDNYKTVYETYKPIDGTTTMEDSDTLVSYKGAIVFKPTVNSSLYANYNHTVSPPGSSNFSLSSSGWSARRPSTNPIFDPQETNSWELGTKWNLLDDRILMSLAYYNTKHQNELAELDTTTDTYNQLGERTIDGFEFTAQGDVTPDWHVNLGVQTMNTEITEGTSGRSSEGASARWSPELTGTLWSSYDFNDKLSFGGGVRYVGEQKRQTDPEADFETTNMPTIPEYWAVDAFASYQINDSFSADLNVYNLFDEDYIDTLNNGGARVIKGEPINGMLTLKYEF